MRSALARGMPVALQDHARARLVEAYAKSQAAAGVTLPLTGVCLISVRERDKAGAVGLARNLVARGFGIALVPHTFARARAFVGTSPKIGIATLKRPGLRWELVAAFHGRSGAAQPRNPAVSAFTEVLSRVRAENH